MSQADGPTEDESYEGDESNGSYTNDPSYSYECCAKPPSPPAPPVDVPLPDGLRLHGRRLSESDIFLGVPFAEAPVGELRWAPPRPLDWGEDAVLDATSFSARCQPLVMEPSCLGFGPSGCQNFGD